MPKPIKVDAGDRAMISQSTGKPVSIDSQKKTAVPVITMPDVQIASMSSNSLNEQQQVAPVVPQTFKPVAKQAIPKMTSSRPVGLSASTGEENDATRDAFGLGLEQVDYKLKDGPAWESEAAEREGRDERTENYFGEQYERGESGWYPLMQSVSYGNTPQNDAYIRNAIENGLSEEDAYEIAHYDPRTLADIGRPGSHDTPLSTSDAYGTSSYNGAPLYDPKTLREHGAGSEAVIDDGTSYDYEHMTSEWMTGPQYKRYVEMGMGGRDVNDIDMAQVYSKADEANDYGFIPYVPNEVTYNRLAGEDIFRMPGEIGTEIANLRTSIAPDYSITYGENDTTVSGKEFDRRAPTFLNNYNYNIQYDPQALLDAPGSTIREYAVPRADGRTSYAHGSLTDYGYDDTLHLSFEDGTEMDVTKEEYDKWGRDGNGNLVVPDEYRRHGGYEGSYDDTLYLTFSDGQTLGLLPDYVRNYTSDDGTIDVKAISDSISNMVPIGDVNGSLPDNLDDLKYDIMPNLVMSDGTVIPYSDVERIYWDETAGNDEDQLDKDGNVVSTDDDIRYGFAPLDINKPRRLMNQEPVDFDRGGLPIDTTDLLSNVVDWTLGSVPISVGAYLPWVYSASQATNAGYGIDPGSYNPETGGRGLSAGGWDESGNLRYGVQDANGEIDQDLSDSTRMWSLAGNAFVPLTEMLVGPVGEHLIPLEGVTKRIPFKTDTGKLVADTLVGYGAEGVEEDLGNIFDELMQYGPSGAFARPVTNDSGETIKDIYGHEVRDSDTGAAQRVGRFLDPNDLANAFLGGALVSPAMGLATTPISSRSFLRNIGPAMYRDAARRQTGVDRYVETDLEREVREALEEGRIPDVPAPRTVSPEYASRFENVRSER